MKIEFDRSKFDEVLRAAICDVDQKQWERAAGWFASLHEYMLFINKDSELFLKYHKEFQDLACAYIDAALKMKK